MPTITGRIIPVADGDTITVLTGEEKQVVIRIAGIDARNWAKNMGGIRRKLYLL